MDAVQTPLENRMAVPLRATSSGMARAGNGPRTTDHEVMPLYQVILGGLVSVAIAVVAYLQAGRVADRQARAQIEVQRLENLYGTQSFWHEDYRALNEKWLQCVEERATCEAERAALLKENAELIHEKQALAEQVAHLDYEYREARQKLVFVDFIRSDGRLSGAQIIEFGRRLLVAEQLELDGRTSEQAVAGVEAEKRHAEG